MCAHHATPAWSISPSDKKPLKNWMRNQYPRISTAGSLTLKKKMMIGTDREDLRAREQDDVCSHHSGNRAARPNGRNRRAPVCQDVCNSSAKTTY
jgi:hypothetical protein